MIGILPHNKVAIDASPLKELIWVGVSILLTTALAFLIEPITGYPAVALLYLLSVVAVGLKLRRGPVLLVAAAGAILWNFLFIPPRLTLYIERVYDGMMFATFFVVAIAMGHLTGRLRLSELAERRREKRTAALYELTHQAVFATDLNAGLRAAIELVESNFGVHAALLLRQKDHTLSPVAHPASSFSLSKNEQDIASWAFTHKMSAGRLTNVFANADAIHLPLQARSDSMGVLSVRLPEERSFGPPERELLETFAVLIGLILEKNHVMEAIKRAEILETSERLRRALLDSVSHELKTPLSAVQTGIDALARQIGEDDKKQATLREVLFAVRRLHRVINNLLDMTRIETGVVKPKVDWSDVNELIHGAIELAGEAVAGHKIVIEIKENLPMVKIDYALIEQALCNLLVNAANWSEPGTTITTLVDLVGEELVIAVRDEGPGIASSELQHVFRKFYRASDARPGGMGLGLSIVDGFVRAHGGSVRALSPESGGAEFQMRLPVEIMSESILESLQ